MDQLALYRRKTAGIDAVKAALVEEAQHRRGRSFKEWSDSEAKAVWAATRDFAQQHGLRVPSLAEVVEVERQASGHSDYGSKWALYAVELTFAAAVATQESRSEKPNLLPPPSFAKASGHSHVAR